MAKKRFIRIPKVVSIKCPLCGEKSKRNFPLDLSPPYFDCDKCKKRSITPITSCCIICAFSNKRCFYSLQAEAKRKSLELK